MPWRECSKMDARGEFVCLAAVAGANVSLLCKRFGISRKTGYKWLSRSRTGGGEATCVTYVPEHLLPMSPVRTSQREREFCARLWP